MDNGGGMRGISPEKVVEMWNALHMSFPLSVSDLSPVVKPSLLMGALMEILAKLGIDRDAIVSPPREEERDEHTEYYWDLMPLINMTRIVNHVLSGSQGAFNIHMMALLNPSPSFAHFVLMFLINLASFYGERRDLIEPKERKLYEHREQVAALEEQRNNLLEQLNEQAAAKASRAMRLQKLEEDSRARAEELRSERLHHEDELRELEQILGENRELQASHEKQKALREALAAEASRARSQLVTDADDVRAQHEAAARGEREVVGRLDALKEQLRGKEGAVRTLRDVKRHLDDGIAHMLEITALTLALEEAKLSSDRDQVEVDAVVSEKESALREAEGQLAELQRERRELHEETQRWAAADKVARSAEQSAARDAESRWRARVEQSERAVARTAELRARIDAYGREKLQHEERLVRIRDNFFDELKSWEQAILKESKKSVATMDEKLSRLH